MQVYTHSCLCFLNFEVPKVRLCPVSAPPPLNACGKEKFLNFPCTAFSRAVHLPGSPQHHKATRTLRGTWACSPKYEGRALGFFLELLITKDLQTGQSKVLLCVSWCQLSGSEMAEGVTHKFFSFASSLGCSRGALGKLESSVVWNGSKTAENDLEDL